MTFLKFLLNVVVEIGEGIDGIILFKGNGIKGVILLFSLFCLIDTWGDGDGESNSLTCMRCLMNSRS